MLLKDMAGRRRSRVSKVFGSADMAVRSPYHVHAAADDYAVRWVSDLSPLIAACAAASLAIGTR